MSVSRFGSFSRHFFIFCLLGGLLTACGSSSPEGVVKDFYKAVADNRIEKAMSFISFEGAKENELTMVQGKMQMIVGDQYSKIRKADGLKSIETKIVTQEGDTATVEATLTYGNGKNKTEKFHLGNEKGGWKIRLKSR
ncbi:MAG: DUF4878 domain-containing protein [Azoarcus sp.]|jgi:hypothetical protein|nr:DUF4878 domain-containing protein [Azoarcus sp.]